jgi:hypothetical protein
VFYLSGNVTIANNGVALDASDYDAKYNTIIYIGSSFNPVGTIAIDVYSYDESDFGATWGSANGRAFLKGGTADSPTSVTAAQAAKFTGGKAAVNLEDDNADLAKEKTGGVLSITGPNTDGFGVAKWTAGE